MSASPEIAAADTPVADPFRLRLAAEVRAHLARRGWSHRRFATVIGSTPPWVARRLNGTTPMTSDDIELFANVLGMAAEDLVASVRPAGALAPFRPAAPQTSAAAASPTSVAATETNYGSWPAIRPGHLRLVPDLPHDIAVAEMAAAS